VRWALVVTLLVCGSAAGAETLKEKFDAGVKALLSGDSEKARQVFHELHDRYGVTSPDLLIDLAAAEYEAGHPGQCLLNLHRAILSAPDTPAAETARVAIKRVRAAMNQAGTQGGFVFGPVSDAWTVVCGWARPDLAIFGFLALWSLAFLGLAAWRLARGRGRVFARYLAIVAFCLALPAGVLAYGSNRVASYRVAVVLADGTPMYDAIDSLDKALTLPEGAEVRFIEARGRFARVRLSSGREGYVPEDALGLP